jgi:hypothetical protein
MLLHQMLERVSARGTKAFSLAAINLDTYEIVGSIAKAAQSYSLELFQAGVKALGVPLSAMPMNTYFIGHLQSPTSTTFSFHPAERTFVENAAGIKQHYLWHNGQMDSLELSKLKDAFGNPPWDTMELLNSLILDGFKGLDTFQGSFACFYLVEGQGLYAFRNAIAPLFFGINAGDICSVKVDDTPVGARRLTKGEVYSIESKAAKNPPVVAKFDNTYNPFGV